VRVWDVESGTELKRITAANPYNAAFSPDDKRIVSGGLHDGTVRVWDVATGKELRHYEGHTATVAGVAFFPDGKRIASASHDGTAHIWRAPEMPKEGEEPAKKKEGRVFKAPGSYTLDVALSPDGKMLARAGAGETVDLWDVVSARPRAGRAIAAVVTSPPNEALKLTTGNSLKGRN
jgi:WD40 repeat protein